MKIYSRNTCVRSYLVFFCSLAAPDHLWMIYADWAQEFWVLLLCKSYCEIDNNLCSFMFKTSGRGESQSPLLR